MSQTDLNTVQSEKESDPNDFRTPWQKQLFGKEEQLVFNRNPNGLVQVRVVSKTVAHDVFQQIAGLFGKKSEPIETRRLEFERAYGNVSAERFESEKKEIQKLLDKHTSLNAILRQIEKDLKNPNLLPEEIAQRQESLTKMRADISALMAQIDEAEASPELQSYEELKSSIERIKEASQIAFLKISNFQNRLKDPAISISQLEELTKEISQLKANNSAWNKDFEIVRKTLSIEKESLQTEIEKLTDQLQSLPDDLKKPWDELIAKWKKPSTLTSSAQIQQYRQEIVKVVAEITEQYRNAFNSKISASIVELQRNLDATTPDFSNSEKQQDHLDFRAQILAYRKGSWTSLNDLWNHSEHNTEAIGTLQKCIQQEQIVDHVLVTTLEINGEEENYIDTFFSLISPITAFIKPLISELPLMNMFQQHDILAAKERFDDTALFYINQTFGQISSTINSLAELIPYEETDELIAKYNDLLADESVLQSDLNAYLDEVIALAQTAVRSDNDEFDKHHINAAILSLQGQKEILSIIIKTQQKHAETMIKKIKEEYPAAFDKNARPSILETANATIDEILPKDDSDYDFKGLSADWQQNRTSLAAQLDTIKHLETLESLQKEFQETAKKREKEIASLTGEEKLQAEEILQDLKKTIDSLDENLVMDSADDTMSYSYRTKLSKINQDFIPIFEIENRKKEMRFHLNQTIDAFTSHLDQCNKAIETMEKHYSISLENARELVTNKMESIKEWKEQGQLPSAYLKYAPVPALSALLYYAPDKLSFEEAKVTDLNLSDLSFYIDNLQAVINNHKNELSSHRILESTFALKAFQDASKQLDVQAKNLMSGITVRTNFSGDQQYQINDGLSTSHLSKLQFHNATLIAERQNKLINQHKKAISAKPDLKFIYQKLSNDTNELTSILEQSQKGQILSLLDQIQKLENYPERQELAKKAFIETITTKLSEHTKSMIDQIKMFKAYPKIQEEAVRQLQRTEGDFFKRLSTAPEVLQYHAEGWKVLRDGKLNFSTKSDLDVQSLSATELKNYLDTIDKMVTQGSDYIKLVKNNYDKVEQASRKFQDKIKEAKTTLNSLNNKDQVIEMERLQSIVSRAEKMKNDFMAASETKEEEFFPALSFFMTPSKNTNPTQAALRILDGYKKNIGDSISKIDAAIKKAKQAPVLTIPQQLALNPSGKTAEELRSRFQNQMRPLIQSTRQDLEQYRNGQSSVAFIRYVSPSCSLMSDKERAIKSKLDELDRFEKGYYSNGLFDKFTHPFAPIPLSEMNSKQMADYQRQLTRLESVMKEDLNKKFQITSLIDAQYAYEKKNEIVIKQLSKLREKELFTEAFLLERKVDEIAKKEAKWVEKVTQPGQLRALVADLKKFDREIDFALSEHHPKKTAASYESQITQLLERKKEFSKLLSSWLEPKNQEILDQINADIAMLKTKLASKIDKGYSEHQDKLIKLKHDIEEIFSTYNIKFQSKDAIVNAIDDESSKFESDSKFDAPQYQFLEKLFNPGSIANSVKYVTTTKKNIEEMDPEEIVQLRPEKNHQALIDGSLKRISDSFDYKVIQEPHIAYQKALEDAEKTQADLIKKDQFIHANTLEEKVNKIKKDHENWASTEIKNPNELIDLSKAISSLTSKLKNATSNAASQPDMDIEDQISQIDDVNAKSPHRERLKNSIVQNIEETMQKQKEFINKSIKYLDNLVNQIGLPYEWREEIISKLDKCLEEFETLNSDLISSYSKEAARKARERSVVKDTVNEWGETIHSRAAEFEENHPYIAKAGKYVLPSWEKVLQDGKDVLQAGDNLTGNRISKSSNFVAHVVNVGSNLFNSDIGLPLSELPLDDLVQIHKTIKSGESKIKEVSTKYNLKKLNEQLKSYDNQVKATEKLKEEWNKEYYFDSVEKLDELLNACQSVFQNYFNHSQGRDLQANMKELLFGLKEATSKLYYQTAEIKKDKPKALGELLETLDINSPEYATLCKAIHKKLKASISECKKTIDTYFKKIDEINKQIQQKTPDCPILPNQWRRSVEEIFNKKQEYLDAGATGLSNMGSSPFKGWTPQEIQEFEKRINELTAKETDTKAYKNSGMAYLEKATRLKEIEKYFTNFQKATKNLETAIAKPNISLEKKETLEAIHAATNKIVYSCIKNMQHIQDSSFVCETLEQAQAILYRASQEGIAIASIDPWSKIYKNEESKAATPQDAFDEIISSANGWTIGYISHDPDNRGQQQCDVISFKQKIEIAKKQLETTKESYEKSANEYSAHKQVKSLDDFLKVKLPEFQKQLDSLVIEVSIEDKDGNIDVIKVGEINTFNHVLAYKNQIDSTIGNYHEALRNLQELGFYPKNQAPQDDEEQFDPEKKDSNVLIIEGDDPSQFFSVDEKEPKSNSSESIISTKTSSKKAKESTTESSSTSEFKPDTLPTATEQTIAENLKQLKTLNDAIEVIKNYEPFFNPELCEIIELDALAQRIQNNKLLIDAITKFKTVWNSGFVEKLQEDALQIGLGCNEAINKILAFNETLPFKTNLSYAYDKIMRTADSSQMKNWSIAEWLVHLNNLANAPKIKVQLENMAKSCLHIYALSLNVDNLVDTDGKSVYLTANTSEQWINPLNNYTKTLSYSNLSDIEIKLSCCATNCDQVFKNDEALRTEKKRLVEEIAKIERQFKKKIDLIENTGKQVGAGDCFKTNKNIEDNSYDSFKSYVYGKIDALKLKELSSSELQRCRTDIVSTLNMVDKTAINQGYMAVKKFEAIYPATKQKIEELKSAKQYAAAQKLQAHLDNAKKLFDSVFEQFNRFDSDFKYFILFTSQMESLVQKLKTDLDAKENTIDFISQLKQVSDWESHKNLTDTIIKEISDKAKKIESVIDNSSKKQAITNIIKEIKNNINKLITSITNTSFSFEKKQEFITQVNKCDEKFIQLENAVQAINKITNLHKNSNTKLNECIKKADFVLEEVKKTIKPIQYFYINKIPKLKEQANDCINKFNICLNSNERLEILTTQADDIIETLTSFELSLEEIRNKKRMTPFEQLKAAVEEPEILNDDIVKHIVDGVKIYGSKLILQTSEQVRTFSNLIQDCTKKSQDKIDNGIQEKLEDLLILDGKILISSAEDLEQLIQEAAQEKDAAIKIHGYLSDYQYLMGSAEKLLNRLQNNPQGHAELTQAINKIKETNQNLLKNFDNFEVYCKALLAERHPLEKLIRTLKDDLDK